MDTKMPIPIPSAVSFFEPVSSIHCCVIHIPQLIDRYFPGSLMKDPACEPDAFNLPAREWGVQMEERFSSFRIFKRQMEWFCGRAAFSILAAQHNLPATLGIEEGGAPFIEGSPFQVSITHAGDYAAAAVSLDPEQSLGIDMERVRGFKNRDGFLNVAFPEKPAAETAALSDNEIMELWTLKESFLKIIRKGFAENLREVEILPDAFVYRGRRIDTLCRKSHGFDGHILSFVYGRMR